MANADYKIPNQLNTRSGIASITKLMTTVILNRLVENKQISLADKLAKYIPDFPGGDKISIEMIARHRSGIPHRVMPPEAESVAYTSAEFIEKVKLAKLAFEPGTACFTRSDSAKIGGIKWKGVGFDLSYTKQ